MLHSVYDQPDAHAVHAQFDRLLDYTSDKLPAVTDHLDHARADILTFTSFPVEVWHQIWSNNPTKRALHRWGCSGGVIAVGASVAG